MFGLLFCGVRGSMVPSNCKSVRIGAACNDGERQQGMARPTRFLAVGDLLFESGGAQQRAGLFFLARADPGHGGRQHHDQRQTQAQAHFFQTPNEVVFKPVNLVNPAVDALDR